MSHLSTKRKYNSLIERLNRFPQGAPPSELLYKILGLLFTEQEASLVGQLPVLPFTAAKAARLWQLREVEAARVLEGLADRGLMLDIEREDEKLYVLPPPVSGFFGFSLMRTRGDLDQEALSELLYRYLNKEEAFVSELYNQGETKFGRILVDEDQIPEARITQVYDYERASEVIRDAVRIGVGSCACRQKMKLLGHGCGADSQLCMTFDSVADALVRHGHAREISKSECRDLLQKAREQNLVQFGENAREGVSFICNCCSCCCESLTVARKFAALHPVHTTNFQPELRAELCDGCGKCADVCPVEAVNLVSAHDPKLPGKRKCVLELSRCLGCGVCSRACHQRALVLTSREPRVVTPLDSAHRVVLMAIERGKLQHLIWDNHALFSHRMMATIIGVILRLPSVKQALAKRQLGSKYLDFMIKRRSDRVSWEACRLRY